MYLYTKQKQECSPDYITITNLEIRKFNFLDTNIYNQKVAAAGDEQLAEQALPFYERKDKI